MNSILIFGGCAAMMIIMLVTCLIMTTGCYKRDKGKKKAYTPSRQRLFQPYAVDTMTLDHRKYSRRENFQSVEGGKQYEPTTIERWVNSQLSKGRRQSSAVDLNQNGQLDSAITKSDSHQDMSTTDSGIVSTEPRRTDFTAQVMYGADDSGGHVYHEPHHNTCNSIDYIQHHNEAYTKSPHTNDLEHLEESSKL